MEWIWIVPIGLFVIITIYINIDDFIKISRDKKIEAVQEWLLYAVSMAEREFGSGTGVLKLRSVYDRFVQKFPKLITLISFTTFQEMVDKALENMEHYLKTNRSVANIIKGEEENTFKSFLDVDYVYDNIGVPNTSTIDELV